MPTYWYKTLDKAQGPTEGTIAAPTRREALLQLIAQGSHPIDLREQDERKPAKDNAIRFRKRLFRLAPFCRQLATLSASGIPIIKGLNVLLEQQKEPRAKQMLIDVRDTIQGGSTFADALERHPQNFPPIMTNLIRVGEQGGTLDTELVELSDLFEKEEALSGEVRSALAYPTLVLLTGLISAVILIAFFIPRLKVMFDDVGQKLPLPTRMLLACSDAITGHPVLILATLVVLFGGIAVALRYPAVRLALDTFKLRIPWMGPLLQNLEIARLTRVLGTLTRGGVSIVEALAIVKPVMSNRFIAQNVDEITTRIRTGERLGNLMKERAVFPPLCVQMVSVGEETGMLDEMLLRVADAYDRETTAATKVMTSMLAPVMILLVAAVVGFIVISMLLPIFQLSSVIG